MFNQPFPIQESVRLIETPAKYRSEFGHFPEVFRLDFVTRELMLDGIKDGKNLITGFQN